MSYRTLARRHARGLCRSRSSSIHRRLVVVPAAPDDPTEACAGPDRPERASATQERDCRTQAEAKAAPCPEGRRQSRMRPSARLSSINSRRVAACRSRPLTAGLHAPVLSAALHRETGEG
jgi:hypothetical protein